MVWGQIRFRNSSAVMDWVEMGMTCPRNISCLTEEGLTALCTCQPLFSLGIVANLIAQQKAMQFNIPKR